MYARTRFETSTTRLYTRTLNYYCGNKRKQFGPYCTFDEEGFSLATAVGFIYIGQP